MAIERIGNGKFGVRVTWKNSPRVQELMSTNKKDQTKDYDQFMKMTADDVKSVTKFTA